MLEPKNKQNCFLLKATTVDKRNKERDNSQVYFVKEEIPCKLINVSKNIVFETNGGVKVKRSTISGELEICMLDIELGQGDKIKLNNDLYQINQYTEIKDKRSLFNRKRYIIQAAR